MKVSIIGFGKMGKIRATAIEKCGGQVVGVFDSNIVDNSGYKVYDKVDDVFDDPNIDAIFVCTPNFLNAKYTIRGIQSGKHVFCEKPPALNVSEMEEVILEESKYDKKIMYGFNHRHHGSIIKMKELIDSNYYGNILWMRGRYGKNVDDSFFENWRSDKSLSGGGILIDQGIHMLDLFLYMGESFDKISASVSNQFWKIDGIEDNVFAILENTKSNITASLHSTMTQWRHLFSFEIFLEKGYMTLNGLKTPSGSYGEEVLTIAKNQYGDKSGGRHEEIHLRYPVDGSWETEVGIFFDCVKNNKEVSIGNTKDAIKIMDIIENIYDRNKL